MDGVQRLAIPDVLLITPSRFGDERGFFSETYSKRRLAEFGFDGEFVQDNHSMSARRGTLRGLHFQRAPVMQDKLVRVARGAIFDVAVDIRSGSSTFGQWVGAELSAENWAQLLVPAGFAHGFVTLADNTEVLYKATAFYAPDAEDGLAWNDPAVGVRWPLDPAEIQTNARDSAWPGLDTFSPV